MKTKLILKQNCEVSIIMGSKSDFEIMKDASDILKKFNISHEVEIVSAHRTPEWMFEFAKNAEERGVKIIIAGAGGAAHLPGMVASLTNLPVIGVPIKSSNSLDGWDSILSILQMPKGVPVSTMALNNSTNAALLTIRILALNNNNIKNNLNIYIQNIKNEVLNEKNLNEKK